MSFRPVPTARYDCPVPGCRWAFTVIGYPPLSSVVPYLLTHLADHGVTEDDVRLWLGLTAGT